MAKKMTTSDALLNAASYADDTTFMRLEILTDGARKMAAYLQEIEASDVFLIGMTDTLERAKRNAVAYATLLSMAADAAGYIKSGISEIMAAHDASETVRKEKQRLALQREIEYKKRQKQNERYRAKKKAEAGE